MTNHPQIKGMEKRSKQFFRPTLLDTKPAANAPKSWPTLQILAIHDLSSSDICEGNWGRRIALKPKTAPRFIPVRPPITKDARTYKKYKISEKIHGGPLTFVVIQWRHNALNQWVFLIETLVKWRHTAFENHPNMSHSNSPKKSHSQHFRGQKYLFWCLKTALDELQSLHKWTQRSRQMRPFLFTFKHCASWMFLLFCTSSLSWDTLKELWQQKLVVPHGKIVFSKHCDPVTRCLKITEKVSFNIASEASYVYILSGQKII